VIGSVLWMAGTWGFTQYVEHFGKYNVTYGSIGGVVVLLLWLYITGLIFILGGELNAILEHASKDARAKAKGTRAPGEASPLEPPLKTPGSAKSASSARKTARSFWRWRRRVARGQSPEPSGTEPPNPSFH
jgi:membrane protein